jgi:hypothetical protein
MDLRSPEAISLSRRPQFIYVGGVKGGTGKSMTCASIVDYLRQKGPLMVVETDTGNPDIYLAHEPETHTESGFYIERANLDESTGWHHFFNCLAVAKERNISVVINSRGANQSSLTEFASLLQEAIDTLEVPFKTFWCINNETFSVGLLEAYLAIMPKVPVFVVKNRIAGKSFAEFEASEGRKRLESQGFPSLELGVLAETPRLALLNRMRSVRRALTETDFATRLQIQKWNRDFHAQLATVI